MVVITLGGYWHSTEHMAILFTFVRWHNLLLFIALIWADMSSLFFLDVYNVGQYEQSISSRDVLVARTHSQEKGVVKHEKIWRRNGRRSLRKPDRNQIDLKRKKLNTF